MEEKTTFGTLDAKKCDFENENAAELPSEVASDSSAERVLVSQAKEGSLQGKGNNCSMPQEEKPSTGTGEAGEGCAAGTGAGLPPPRGDGEVTLMYEMYDEKFPIKVMMTSEYYRCRSCVFPSSRSRVYIL